MHYSRKNACSKPTDALVTTRNAEFGEAYERLSATATSAEVTVLVHEVATIDGEFRVARLHHAEPPQSRPLSAN